ncbi:MULTISPECIES: hypothetical protein [unclassified Delftia]|uniref:hypothetical protein n=1 Tax=unclassified Delftia TaxID=2613839 RepID=UPI0006470F81|nr:MULTISPECIES: hypothetical protein [unclassified Delftia]MDC2857532.1 hypothetical protein [Delftia sp. DT-2]
MLSFNTLYGQPAALMRRRIWSGEERKLPAASVRVENMFKAHQGFLPNFSLGVPTRAVWNGRVYAVATATTLYTTPDLRTITSRFVTTGTIQGLAQHNGTIVVSYVDGSQYGLRASTNDVSFTAPAGAQAVAAISRAGGFFFGQQTSTGLSYCYRSVAGTDTWLNTPMPSGDPWHKFLFNGSAYLALSGAGPSWINAAVSDSGASFISSTGFNALRNTVSAASAALNQGIAVGTKFVLFGAVGKRMWTATSEDGHNFDLKVQLLPLLDGEDVQSITSAIVLDGVIYARAVTLDNANASRLRLVASYDAGANWRLFPPAFVPRTGVVDVTTPIFALEPGKGLFLGTQGMGLLSDVDNDREFYYEQGAA